MEYRFQYQGLAEPVLVTAQETVTLDKWYQPLGTPQGRRWSPEGYTLLPPYQIPLDWYEPLSVPVLPKRTIFTDPTRVVEPPAAPIFLDWWRPLSEPIFTKPRLTPDGRFYVRVPDSEAATQHIRFRNVTGLYPQMRGVVNGYPAFKGDM